MNRVLLLGLAIAVGTFPVLILNQTATAAQITSRSVLISNPHVSATATYTFGFTQPSTSLIQSIKFQACTTPLGVCTSPTGTPAGINLSGVGATITQDASFVDSTSFIKDTSTTGCTTVDVLCVKRTSSTPETPAAHKIIDTGAINQDGTNCSAAVNCTFFIRISTYSTNTYTSQVDDGTVAAATTQRLTVNAAIQEALTFCVGATTVDDLTINPEPICSLMGGTSLDLGVLSTSTVSVSPVDNATNLGDGKNGVAELSTNAVNGASVTYRAVQDTGTNHLGTLRVPGASCNSGTVNTDQCINPIGPTKSTLAIHTENFGMAVAGISCLNTVAYSCSFTGGTAHLIRTTNYNATGTNVYDPDTDQVVGTTSASYAWDESGSAAVPIATSTTVVDAEAMILKFAATPNAITPTGSYQVSADFVATPTF